MVNPITSSMSKYYEKTKSGYSRDIDHLITFNRNGLWIKENFDDKQRIISAAKPEGTSLLDVTIFHLDNNSNLIEKIISKKANISKNDWILEDGIIFKTQNELVLSEEFSSLNINSIYDYEKITSLFKNFDTMSFLDLIINYKDLINSGYDKSFLNQSLHTSYRYRFSYF